MDIVIIDGLSFALPLFIMAIGGIYCEKSGVTMLAVEGLQGFGAFIGAFVAVAIAGNFAGDLASYALCAYATIFFRFTSSANQQ